MDIQCPHCPEPRLMPRALLLHHQVLVHGQQNSSQRAPADAAPDLDVPTLCICGEPLYRVDPEDDPDWWIHRLGVRTPCTDPRPMNQTPFDGGRRDLSEQLPGIGVKLTKVSSEIRALREKADLVAERLAALDAEVMSPSTVRRATLNQVWDRLVESGNITGAQLVQQMLSQLSEGDWS
jgi:hypothetical protein